MKGKHLIVLSDDEEPFEAKLEAARNNYILCESRLTNDPVNILFAAIMSKIPGSLNNKKKVLCEALDKHFKGYIGFNVSKGNFCGRIDSKCLNNPIDDKCFFIYGVDFLTTKMIFDRFMRIDVCIKEIMWMNESSCIIRISNSAEAQLFFLSITSEKELPKSDCNFNLNWYKTCEYTFLIFQRPLIFRYVTLSDFQLKREIGTNKFKMFEEAKKSMPLVLLEIYKAKQCYMDIITAEERSSNHKKRHIKKEIKTKIKSYSSFTKHSNNQTKKSNESEEKFQFSEKYHKKDERHIEICIDDESIQSRMNLSFVFQEKKVESQEESLSFVFREDEIEDEEKNESFDFQKIQKEDHDEGIMSFISKEYQNLSFEFREDFCP